MPTHLPDCRCGAYACTLRGKGLDVLPSATPSRTQNRKQPFRPIKQPSWQKGRITQKRPGGFEMPVLNDRGQPMSVHQAQNQRSRIREGLRLSQQGIPIPHTKE